MAYDQTKDRRSDKSSPAEAGYNLTAAMVADDTDLPTYGKSIRIRNGTSVDVKIVVTPIRAESDTAVMTFTIGAGDRETLPLGLRRVWSSGSTGLVAGITAGTVEVQVYTE